MAKEFKKISAQTIPNGYLLKVESYEYVYFTLEDFLEGFMYHVGMEELGAIDKQLMSDFISAAIVWRADDGKTAKEMMRLKEENEELLQKCEMLKEKNKALHERCKKEGRSSKKDDDDDDDDDDE